MSNNNINIDTVTGSNSGPAMTSNNSCNSDGTMSNSVSGCNNDIGRLNNNEASSKSSSSQHIHHHSPATAFSAAAGFWSAAYQGKNRICIYFFLVCIVLIVVLFHICLFEVQTYLS